MQNQQPQHVYHQPPTAGGIMHPGYAYPGSQASPAINPQALAVGQPSIQHPNHQTVSPADTNQYHQLQSSTHHNASTYYRHLYPPYQQQQHGTPLTDQSHYYPSAEHHHQSTVAPTGVPQPTGVAPNASNIPAQQLQQKQQPQHVYHQQSSSAITQPPSNVNANSWTGISTPQTHGTSASTNEHAASTYMPSYPGQSQIPADQHLSAGRALPSTQIGSSVSIHSSHGYSMDSLYGTPSSDAYGYGGYNSTPYRSSTNGHTQSGIPPSDISSFWRQGQAQHPSGNSSTIPKRSADHQTPNYTQDPSSYYSRQAYNQGMTSFSQPPHLNHSLQSSDVSQQRINSTSVSANSSALAPPTTNTHQISQPHEQHSLLQSQSNVSQPTQYMNQHSLPQNQYMPTLPSYQTHTQQLPRSSPMLQQYSPISQLASMSRDVPVGPLLSPKKTSAKVDASETVSSKWQEPNMSDASMTPLLPTSSYQQSSLYGQTLADTQSLAPAEVSDPYAIDTQTFEDFDDHPQGKIKKGRPKKGDSEPKKEKKPRASRTPKNPSAASTKGKKKAPASVDPPVIPPQPDALAPTYPAPYQYGAPETFSNLDNKLPQFDPNERSQISPKLQNVKPSVSENQEQNAAISNPNYKPYNSDSDQSARPVFTDMTSNSSTPNTTVPINVNVQPTQAEPVSNVSIDKANQVKPPGKPESYTKSVSSRSPTISPSVAKSTTPTGAPSLYPHVTNQSHSELESSWKDGLRPPSTLPTNDTTTNQTQYEDPDPLTETKTQPTVPEQHSSIVNQSELTTTESGDNLKIDLDELKVESDVVQPKPKKKRPKKETDGDTKKEKKPRKKSAEGTTSKRKRSARQTSVPDNSSTVSVDTIPYLDTAVAGSSSFNSNDGITLDSTIVSINDETTLSMTDKTIKEGANIDIEECEVKPTPKKPRPPRIRDSSKKKKLPKFALKFSKTKKRKRVGSSDNELSDLEKTPPPSPDEVESGVQKRRSARNTKKLRYNDDIELGFSDSDSESQILPSKSKSSNHNATENQSAESTIDQTISSVKDEPTMFAAPVEDTMVVEKVLASRMGKRELEPDEGEVLPPDGLFIDVEEFFVKYKNLSYMHCDWRTLEELEKGDRRVSQKLKRYKQKKDSSSFMSCMDDELFDLQYCEVDRILALNEVEEFVPDLDEEQTNIETKVESGNNPDPKLEDQEKPEAIDVDPPKESVISNLPSEKETNDHETVETQNDDNKEIVKDAIKEETKEIEASTDFDPSNNKTEEANKVDIQAKLEQETAAVNDEASQNEVTQPDDKKSNSEIVDKPVKLKKKITRHFLVKWRSLSYEESTWELEDDLDPEKIKHFMRFKDPPPKSKWKTVKKPKLEDWVKKEVSPVYKNSNTLRPYQLEGINWLSYCWHDGRSCILADEMGLGKTIQSITFINEIYEHGIYGPFLIIVPLSTVGNWTREFETWTDLNVITYHGSSASREMLKEYEMFYRNEQGNRITSYYKFQVMITTFEIILSDCLDLREIPWRCCIIDEAHRLKNRNCKLIEGLRLLNIEHKVLLTGTPLQNNVEELYSLLNFLEPNKFASIEQFLQEFGDLKTDDQVKNLQVVLKPIMLRRLKEDVEKSLAPKEETIVEVELTNIQKKYYRAILEKNFSFLSKGGTNSNVPNLMNTMMELRKCCIHPYLINGAEEQILYEAKQAKLDGRESLSSFQAMVNASGKLVLIDKLLPRLKQDGHRVLIFSQMVRCLDILEDYVTHKNYPFERIDGRVRGSERQQAIDRFSKPGSDRFVFLLCTRAGGLGINLTAADTVIIFDSDWNPQNDLQAQARCHRIGQVKAVKIYRLICRNTYEREMFDKASLKLGLDKAVLQPMNTQKGGTAGLDGSTGLTKKEIEELLRKGAYGALMDDDNAGDKFCEEDIDQILSRRTQVITIDNSDAKGSTFSKATFSASNNREDIDIDDPNFWEKWAKKANFDAELNEKEELIVHEPRRRTQTKRYGADGSLIEISDFESSDEDEETISMRTRGSRGRNTKSTTQQTSKRNKRGKFSDLDDDDFITEANTGSWSKSECFKIEKGLLTYGWGRWEEIISKANFKRDISVEDCEDVARVILLYCLNSYKGDEKIRSFIWELICPIEDPSKNLNESEISISTRGRKSKSAVIQPKRSVLEEMIDAKWIKDPKYNFQDVLTEEQYRRHLQRNSNRLLIRVKYLDYLKNEVFKDQQEKILSDCLSSEVELNSMQVEGDLPASWWDEDADKSLLIGIFKHGHDKFNLIRQDPCLCFLTICGPPTNSELNAEMNSVEDNNKSIDEEEDESRNQSGLCEESLRFVKSLDSEALNMRDPAAGEILESLVDSISSDPTEGDSNNHDSSCLFDVNKNSINKTAAILTQANCISMLEDESLSNIDKSMDIETEKSDKLVFPSANELNQRFRRLITAHQRNSKKVELQMAQKARDELKKERTSKFEAAKNEREEKKRSQAQRWSRREEADFFRAISSFGVEYDTKLSKYDWNKFRSIGKLDKKLDETLDEYYKAFVKMCKKVTSKTATTNDDDKSSIKIEPITEERAVKCLSRIEFLNKIREKIICHPEFDERIKQAQPSSDLPDWWICGQHDKDLLIAAAKIGLTRLDYNLAHDTTYSFVETINQKAASLIEQHHTLIVITTKKLEDLLTANGIQFEEEFTNDEVKDNHDVKFVLDAILDSVEKNESADLTDRFSIKTSPKTTRSSSLGNIHRTIPNILSKRSSSVLLEALSIGPNPPLVKLISPTSENILDHKFVEIAPLLPTSLPEEFEKNFEAGEVTINISTDRGLVQTTNCAPIFLLNGQFQVTSKLRWPKDKNIQSRLESLVQLIERNEWGNQSKANIPTITLPAAHLTSPISQPSLNLSSLTSSNAKTEKNEFALESPTSDISSASKNSKQTNKERAEAARNLRKARGRKAKNVASYDESQFTTSSIIDEGQAAKLRNLLSQGTSSKDTQSNPRATTKFPTDKSNAGLSSLLSTLKQKSEKVESGSSKSRNEPPFDFNLQKNSANLLPQLIANMKPEFKDLLSNPETASMLLNSLTGFTSGSVVPNLRSSSSNTKSTSKAPPPAHQRANVANDQRNSRDLRRTSNMEAQSSLNLRSTRGKSSPVYPVKQPETSRSQTQRKRGRPVSEVSNDSSMSANADALDLSSLQLARDNSTHRQESRSRRPRGSIDVSENPHNSESISKSAKEDKHQSNNDTQSSSELPTRTTRASKRIGSRIDALALNLQAKRLNTGDSPNLQDQPPSPIRERRSRSSNNPFPTSRSNTDNSSKAPPMAHSGPSHTAKNLEATKDSSQVSQSNLLNPQNNSRQSANQLAASAAALLGNLNPSTTDLMNQMLRKQSSTDIMKNILGDLMKNTIDPSILASVSNSIAMNPNLLSGLNLPASKPMNVPLVPGSSVPTTPTVSSMNNSDFKTPSNASSNLSKRTRQNTDPYPVGSDSKKSSQDRRQSSSSSSDKRSSQDKYNEKSSSRRNSNVPVSEPDRRSSSSSSSASLLAQQPLGSQHITNPTSQPSMANTAAASLNQFGGLNLGLLAGLPGMSDIMKQISGFQGLPPLGRLNTAPVHQPTSMSTPSAVTNSDKSSKRSKTTTAPSQPVPQVPMSMPSSSALNAASTQAPNFNMLANMMNLTQPGAGTNPYLYNPLTNPLLFGPLGNFNMNLFSNPYMPGFPPTSDQQSQPSTQAGSNNISSGNTNNNSGVNNTGNSGSSSSNNNAPNSGSSNKKMRYPKK